MADPPTGEAGHNSHSSISRVNISSGSSLKNINLKPLNSFAIPFVPQMSMKPPLQRREVANEAVESVWMT